MVKTSPYTFSSVLSGDFSFRYLAVKTAAASGSDSIMMPRNFGNDCSLNPASVIAR